MMLQKVERNAKSLNEHRELSWLAQKVENGRKAPFSEIVTITPTIAKHILENNDENRPIRESLVQQIAADIEDGLWQLNGESIIISKDGHLNDGQHRLNAVILSGRPIQTVVMFGVSRASRLTVDMGTARQVADVLGMNGTKNTTAAAATSRLLLMHSLGVFNTGGIKANKVLNPTKQKVLDFHYLHSKAIDKSVGETCNVPFFKKSSTAAWGAAHYILTATNNQMAPLFFNKAATGEALKRGDAILTLRMHVVETIGVGFRPQHRLEMILRYWNAWREGRSLARRLTMHGDYPQIEA
jgi:hypothetical protein